MKTLFIILFALVTSVAFAQEEVKKDTVVTAIDPEFVQSTGVYPNPFQSQFVIEAPRGTSVSVVDQHGKPTDLQYASAGVYVVIFNDRKNKRAVRVVKY